MINILESGTKNLVCLDLESKLTDSGIIFLDEEITPKYASEIQAILMYLSSKSVDTIKIFINSPGGEVYSGLAIYDTMQRIKAQGITINTVNVGLAASMASIILMGGSVGHREALSHSTTMLHTVSGGMWGKVEDMKIDAKETERLQTVLDGIIQTDANPQLIEKCKYLDVYLSAEEAKEHSIIDNILS